MFNEEIDYVTSSEEEIDYVTSSEGSFNEEIDYEITNNYVSPSEAEIYYEDSFDGLLNDEEIFDNEMLVDKELNNEGPDEIVDKALSIEKMPSISGGYAPYFKNTTEAKYRQRLPLLPIKTRNIHILNKKTPSTSKDTKKMYYLSITDIIWYSLNNPSLFGQMYFGPGQKVTKNQELWHGDIWKESPRFGQASVRINGRCRTCNVVRTSWTSDDFDLSIVSRYHHLTDSQLEEISSAPTLKRRKELATEYGLHLQPSVLDRLKREKHLQSPQDVYHLTAGKVLRRAPSTNNTLMNLPHQFKRLVNDWFIIEKSFDPEDTNEEHISNVILKKRIPRKRVENLLNISDFRRELASVYREMGYESAFFESSCKYYELACFSLEDSEMDYRLHVGEVVTLVSEKDGE
ncbi:3873_t:CDS:2, partial [Cetraspora pellucida]